MNPHLHAQVRLHGAVIDDRLVEVCGQTWLGECDGAAIPFNGGIVSVQAAAGDLWCRGEVIGSDEPLVRHFGPVELRLWATIPQRLPRDWTWVPDPMLLVATVALVLVGAFVDTLSADFGAAAADRVAVVGSIRSGATWIFTIQQFQRILLTRAEVSSPITAQ